MRELGRHDEEQAIYREYIERLRDRLPNSARTLAFALSELGARLNAAGHYADAEPLLLESHKMHAKAGSDRADGVRDSLIALYDGWDKPEQADRWRQRP